MSQTTPNLNNSLFKRLSDYTYVKVDNPVQEDLKNYYILNQSGNGFLPVKSETLDPSLTYYIKIIQRYFPYIPEGETIYEIDLNQRKINAPSFIAVKDDHSADIVWFKTDRFFEDVDLYSGSCWIQYVNADKEKYFYNSPIAVSIDKTGSEKIVIPWQISKDVAKKEGTVEFAIKFFKISETNNEKYDYILNTATAKTKVLGSLPNTVVNAENDFNTTEINKLYDLFNSLNREYQVYWMEA